MFNAKVSGKRADDRNTVLGQQYFAADCLHKLCLAVSGDTGHADDSATGNVNLAVERVAALKANLFTLETDFQTGMRFDFRSRHDFRKVAADHKLGELLLGHFLRIDVGCHLTAANHRTVFGKFTNFIELMRNEDDGNAFGRQLAQGFKEGL